jgi:hypothetical protein
MKYLITACLIIIGTMSFLAGCVEVGDSTSGVDVCTGDATECGDNHDESTVDNSSETS